ncbi:hypothetical protein BT93_K1284 [Corymbia citriodora subsp. variegata]|nr:hypothetical protein BT93_K1284 [Corymbia citriodora subsp. variegata]
MQAKEDGEAQEERPSSPYYVLQHFSEGAIRVANEAIHSVYAGGSAVQRGHRRSQSDVMHRRSNNLQKWKAQMQKAWRWGSSSDEQRRRSSFNPEVLANQKRQWYQLHARPLDNDTYVPPTSLFEHFIIAGLHSDANLEVVEDAFVRRKKWESEMEKSELIDSKLLQNRGPSFPSLEPQILFKYPPGKRLAMRPRDLAAFCFPGGVKAQMLERTPSLSDLNELVYGQEHLGRDDLSFLFSFKQMADNATLYGVCLHVPEIVQRPPGIVGNLSPRPLSSGGCRFLVSAPRCYCLLTRVPFFELHYEMLNSIIAQERLDRITQFVNEMTLTSYIPSETNAHDVISKNDEYHDNDYRTDWMASAIPLHSAFALTAAAAGLAQDSGISSSSIRSQETQSPEAATASDVSESSHGRQIDNDVGRLMLHSDDNTSEISETRSESLERMSECYENGLNSPEVGSFLCHRNRIMERLGSSESLYSPVRSVISEDEDDDLFPNPQRDLNDDVILEWARETKNGLLQIVCSYHALPLPPRGGEMVFQPLEHLQAISYRRPPISALGLSKQFLDLLENAEVHAKIGFAETALALSLWTTATICRVLSLESVLWLVAGVLLEKQIVLVCPNLGILSASVLSLIPMIQPFEWQSLLLPVLPERMFDFLDAPVPFIVGIQHKFAELKMKTSNLVQVNVLKDQVKMCHLPALPRYKELVSELKPIHARLSRESSIAKRHPVYKCSEVQAEAASRFLTVMRNYLDSLCSDLRSCTITSVQSNNDRVSLLLKDSFVDSFPSRDRPFIKMFVDTQMFSVLSDAAISTCESRRF